MSIIQRCPFRWDHGIYSIACAAAEPRFDRGSAAAAAAAAPSPPPLPSLAPPPFHARRPPGPSPARLRFPSATSCACAAACAATSRWPAPLATSALHAAVTAGAASRQTYSRPSTASLAKLSSRRAARGGAAGLDDGRVGAGEGDGDGGARLHAAHAAPAAPAAVACIDNGFEVDRRLTALYCRALGAVSRHSKLPPVTDVGLPSVRHPQSRPLVAPPQRPFVCAATPAARDMTRAEVPEPHRRQPPVAQRRARVLRMQPGRRGGRAGRGWGEGRRRLCCGAAASLALRARCTAACTPVVNYVEN
jgi:hypothetical protein